MTVCMVTMAVALPAVMGRVNAPARRAQAGVVVQGLAWALLLLSGLAAPGSLADRALSTLAMAGIAGGLALSASAFDLWCGRDGRSPLAAGDRHRHAARLLHRLLELSVPGRLGQWPADAADGVVRRDRVAQARRRGRTLALAARRRPAGADGRHARARHPRRVLHRELSHLPRAASGELRLRGDRQRDHGAVADGRAARASRRGGARARAARHRRRPDRRAQPQRLDEPRRDRAGGERALWLPGGGADDRPRPLQADQRHPRPCRRRPGADVRRPRPARRRCARATSSAATAARSSAS